MDRGSPAARRPRGADHPLRRRKLAEIAACDAWGREQVGALSDRDLLIAGAALYAGEGSKRQGMVSLANTNPDMIALFCRWLRTFFVVDESRLRVFLYLHADLDVEAARRHWSSVTAIPEEQFSRPYRAVADPARTRTKHVNGCATVRYACSRTHREVMGLVRALLAAGDEM